MQSDHHTIHLDALSGSDLDEVVGLWDPETGGTVDDFVERVTGTKLKQYLIQNPNAHPLRSVLSAARSRWRAVALREHPYYDLEFWHSHAGLYEWCFKDYDIACERLHFFGAYLNVFTKASCEVDFAIWLRDLFVDGRSWNQIRAAFKEAYSDELVYLGYCVLRPTGRWVVSRTAMRLDHRTKNLLPEGVHLHRAEKEQDGSPRLRVAALCCANLLNARMELSAPEFIQQDPHLGACATASLWVTTRNIDNPAPSTIAYPYASITRHALGDAVTVEDTVDWDPNAGDESLTVSQIRRAVARTGWHILRARRAESLPLKDETVRLRNVVYSLLNSRFPVILCATDAEDKRGHAVALVGVREPMSFDCAWCKSFPEMESDQLLYSTAPSVFYAHDDAYGPYSRVVFEWGKAVTEEEEKQGPAFLLGRVPERTMYLRQIVIPIPHDVRHSLENCLSHAIDSFEQGFAQAFRSNHQSPHFVWRSLLLRGAEFKQSLVNRGYAAGFMKWYGSLHLPQHVWLHELAVVLGSGVQPENPFASGGRVAAEYLYDATAPYHDVFFLSERVETFTRDYRDPPDLLPSERVAPLSASIRPYANAVEEPNACPR